MIRLTKEQILLLHSELIKITAENRKNNPINTDRYSAYGVVYM